MMRRRIFLSVVRGPWSVVDLDAHRVSQTTDNSDPGVGFEDNWDLSSARAIAVYKAAMEEAPQLGRLQNRDEDHLFSVRP